MLGMKERCSERGAWRVTEEVKQCAPRTHNQSHSSTGWASGQSRSPPTGHVTGCSLSDPDECLPPAWMTPCLALAAACLPCMHTARHSTARHGTAWQAASAHLESHQVPTGQGGRDRSCFADEETEALAAAPSLRNPNSGSFCPLLHSIGSRLPDTCPR